MDIALAQIALRFLVEVLQNVAGNRFHASRREQLRHPLLNRGMRVWIHGCKLVVLHTERQDVLIPDSVHNRVRVEQIPEGLRGCLQIRVGANLVLFKDWRAGKAKEIRFLELLFNRRVHAAELGAVALIEDEHHVFVVNLALIVTGNKMAHFLDRGDHDL